MSVYMYCVLSVNVDNIEFKLNVTSEHARTRSLEYNNCRLIVDE